ncbi:MAG: single-stranded DNA-binding protein [Dehalococcoidales bacterium]|jgi:single-strand DNA-binding protein
MVSLNKMTIIGNLGSEPEMRFTPSGRPVTSFSIATNWRYTTAEGERKEDTEWFSVVAWGKLAEQCNQFLTKGRLVYIEGRLRLRTWEGQDGKTRARNEIIAEKVKFLDRQGAPAATGEAKPDEVEPTGDVEPDDIPF